VTVDWPALPATAQAAAQGAYAPYSRLRVGAAAGSDLTARRDAGA
jgi:cytidine deaminase